jgi:hypothetical protein
LKHIDPSLRIEVVIHRSHDHRILKRHHQRAIVRQFHEIQASHFDRRTSSLSRVE